MKKSVHFLCFLSILALFLSLEISASAQNAPQSQKPDAQSQPAPQPDAQQPQSKPAQPPDQAAPPANDSAQSSQSAGVQTFTGTIVKSGDKYTFQEEATGKTYDIDHQNEVQKFDGKKVKVHGTLDASANMIHVQ
jgi:cytoskeletal protein RodZ